MLLLLHDQCIPSCIPDCSLDDFDGVEFVDVNALFMHCESRLVSHYMIDVWVCVCVCVSMRACVFVSVCISVCVFVCVCVNWTPVCSGSVCQQRCKREVMGSSSHLADCLHVDVQCL